MSFSTNTKALYRSVVDDVINNVRDFFLDDGSDEQTLQELKNLWESKLNQSKALETDTTTSDPQRVYASYTAQRQQKLPPQQVLLQHKQEPQVVPTAATGVATSQQQQLQQQPQQQEIKPAITMMHPQPAAQVQLQPQAAAVQQPIPSFVLGADGSTVQLSSAAQAATVALPPNLYPQPPPVITGLSGLPPGSTIFQGPDGQRYIMAPQQPTFTVASTHQPQQQPGATITQGATPGARQYRVQQTDGPNDSSSDDDDDDGDRSNDDDDDNDDKEEGDEEQGEEEDPLNSDDDISDADPSELFETDNVVVCQFDKINRAKNRWKFHLKDGIMNLNGKDHVFQKATGDAEW